MPSYKGHIVGGIAAFFIVHHTLIKVLHYQPLNPKEIFLAVSFCVLGALFPDIDIKSVGQKIFYGLLTIVTFTSIIAKQWTIIPLFSLLGIFPIFTKHRGITHTIWFALSAPLLIPLVILYCSPQYDKTAWLLYSYFASGALSHILLDYTL